MFSRHFKGASVVALAALASGCASRSVPHTYPPASAASYTAAEAPPAVVARALEGDPPLPGKPTAGWSGLAQMQRTPGASPHARPRAAASQEDDLNALLQRPLDADAAVRIALVRNRELQARLRELGVARAKVLQAGLVDNPLVEVEVLPERDSNVELRVEYEITSLLVAPLKQRAERHDLAAARLDVAGEVVQLGYAVRTAFYALQTAEQRLAFAHQTLDALAAGRDAAVALAEAGNVPELHAASQIVAYERARVTVAQIELEVASLREALQRLLGLHGNETQWTVDSTPRPLPEELPALEAIERRAVEENLELRATQQRLEAAAKRTGIARMAGWLPQVAADVHALQTKREGGGDPRWRWGTGVSIEVPLFDHGQGERRGYEAQFDGLRERYQGLAIRVRSAARETSNRMRSAHARARQYETVILPAQKSVMEQTLLQYNAMQVSVFQLLEARRGLLDVQLAHVDTVREYWSAQAEYEALLSGRIVQPTSAPTPTHMAAASGAEGAH